MKVSNTQIASILKAEFARFVNTHKMEDTPELRALFFAGAAIGIALQNGDTAAVEAVTNLSFDALERRT